MTSTRGLAIGIGLWLVLAVSGARPTPVAAGNNVIDVTTTDDELNSDGDCSLREAIVAANTNLAVDACPAGVASTGVMDVSDRIRLPAGRYDLALPGAGENAAATGDLDITDAVTVAGQPGIPRTIVDAHGLDRVFDVAPDVEASFERLALLDGFAGGEEGGLIRFGEICDAPATNGLAGVQASLLLHGEAEVGGGIHIGDCRRAFLRNVTIDEGVADQRGGALSVVGAAEVEIENSTISGSFAGEAGGGIWASLDGGAVSLRYVTIARHQAPDGAAVWMDGVTGGPHIFNTIIAQNSGPACVGIVGGAVASITDDDTCPMARAVDIGLEGLVHVPGHQPVHMLRPGSPAIDLDADPMCGSVLAFDQIQSPRPQDGNGDGVAACDAGAVEADAVSVVPSTPAPSSDPGPALPDTAMPSPAPLGTLLLALGAGAGLIAAIAHRISRRAASRIGEPPAGVG